MLSWLFPMVLLSPVLYFASSKNTAERRGFLCTSGEISALFTVYKMIESVPFYFIPLIIIIILNSWIMHSLRKADLVLNEHGQRNATRHKRNKRIMKMLILIIVIFSYGWIPFGYVFLFIESSLRDLPSNIFDNIYVSCRFIPPVLSTCLNPIIIFSFSTKLPASTTELPACIFVKCQQWFNTDRTNGPEVNVELPEILRLTS